MTTVPKPAKSGYLHFIEEQRTKPEIIQGLKSTEIIKKLGADWKALDESTKQKYEEIAKKDKERFATQKESWLKDHPGQDLPKKERKERKDKKTESVPAPPPIVVQDTPKDDDSSKKKTKKKNSTEPVLEVEVEPEPTTTTTTTTVPPSKKKPNKFINFCKEKRASVKLRDPSKSVTEITTALAELWKVLTDEEKQKYVS